MSFLKKKSRAFRVTCCLLAFLLVENNLERVGAQGTPFLPSPPSNILELSAPYSFPVLRGMRVNPDKPFELDFVVDSGNRHALNQRDTALLIKYFLTFLTIPEEDLWVNLSPYESGRIIPDEFARTDAGNELLEQDKLLKQLSSSLTYPESRLGRKFWQQVYQKAYDRFGTTDLPVNTYNKVWIIPDKAIVYDMGNSSVIGETHLKVMLEEDYLALKKHASLPRAVGNKDLHKISSLITKEIILPELEKEINEGKNFAPVRQIFNSLILADWFKRVLKRNILSEVYVNKKKISGVDGVDKNAKEVIYKQYLHIYKAGAYNYIREDVDPITNLVVPRKYFSGGCYFGDSGLWVKTLRVFSFDAVRPHLEKFSRSIGGLVKVRLNPIGGQETLRKFASKFVLTVALSLMPLAASGLASVATPLMAPPAAAPGHILKFGAGITPADRVIIQKLRGLVRLEDVIALNGQKNPQSGRTYDVDIPYIEKNWDHSFNENREGRVLETIIVAAQHKFGLRFEDGRLGPELARRIGRADQLTPGSVFNSPASQIDQHPVNSDKKFISVSERAAAIPVEDHVVAKSGGIVTGLDQGKKEYKEGETILTLQDLELDSRIEGLRAESQNRENKLGETKALFDAQAATEQEVNQAQQQVQEVEQKLAQAKEEKANDTVTAPHDLKILDIKVANGLSVPKGSQLLRYSDQQRIRVDMDVPISANYFNDINLSLNGNPVKSIFSYNWSPTPSLQKTHLSLIVVPSSPIIPGQAVRVSARINYPDQDNQKLYSIAAGQTTLAEVGRVEEYSLPAPGAGAVSFMAHEGDKVKEGQLLAKVDVKPYQDELGEVDRQISNIDLQINQAAPSADGTQYVDRERLDSLKVERFKLLARQKFLQEQISRSEIRSPYNSVIDWSAENTAGVFQSQDALFHIPGPVFLGDINNAKNAILFSNSNKINAGDPVLVRTPQGIRLISVVTAVNKNPSSPSVSISQYQSIEIKVFDPQHALRPGLGVQVSLIKDIDKQAVLSILSAVSRSPSSSSAPPPPPPKTPFDAFASQLFAVHATGPSIVAQVPPPYYFSSPQGPSLNSSDVVTRVLGNELVAGPEYINYLKSKANEGLPGALQFSLFGNVLDNNGKLTFAGGASGALNGWAGTALTGNAIGAGLPIVTQLVGNLIDHVDGRIKKEKGVAADNTKIAYYRWLTVLYQQTYEAQKLLIELGADQQALPKMEARERNLKLANEEMAARVKAGFNSTSESQALDREYRKAQEELLALKSDMQDKRIKLNVLTGEPITDLEKPVSADLPWTNNFPSISEAEANYMRANLIAKDSLNTQMQEDLVARKKMGETLELQGLERLPELDLTSIGSSGNPGGSKFDLLPGAQEHTSQLAEGFNNVLRLRIPIFNKPLKIARGNAVLDAQNADNNIKRTRLSLTAEFDMTVNHINNLSEEIQLAEKAYVDAYNAWNLKAGNKHKLFLDSQLVDDESRMNAAWEDLVHLKADYFKAKAYLEQLGLLKQGGSLAKDQSMISDKAQVSLPSSFFKLSLFLTLAVMPLAAQQGDQPTGSFGFDPANTWALSRGGAVLDHDSLTEIERILITDPNIFTRTNALQHFLGEFQDNNEAVSSMKRVILRSPYMDVVQELFRFMIARNNTDLRFFIEIINKAESNNNKALIFLAYQSLEDALMNDPDKFKGLTRTDFTASGVYPGVSPEKATAVFLSWLAADPVDSMAKTTFLQSNYWSPEDLAGIYNGVNAYADNGRLDDAQVKKIKYLAGIIYDSILWREAWWNIDDTIPLGWYKDLNGGIPNFWDSTSRVWILELRGQNRRFLNSSRWREMKKFLHPQVYAKAEKITRELIANNPATNISEPPVRIISYNGQITNNYFITLDLTGLKKYIEGSGICELARMLETSTFDREIILNRLMASRDGRLLVLQDYDGSNDQGLLRLIETRNNWLSIIKEDALLKNSDPEKENLSMGKAAADGIIRGALLKMFQRTHNDSFLDLLLEMRSSLELYSDQTVQDPRGDAFRIAEINRRAAGWALDALEESWKHRQAWSPWRGFDVREKEELDLGGDIRNELENEDNPVKFESYLKNKQATDVNPTSRKMFKDLMSVKYRFADDIMKNNQRTPHLPAYLVLLSLGVSGFLGFLAGIIFNVRGWFRHKSDPDKESKWVKKALFGNGNGKNGHNGANGYNGNNGDKAMISIPIEREIPKPAFDSLQTWRERVSRWTKPETLTVEDILSDFNIIINCAAEVLRTLPYSPDLIWSEKKPLNEDFRATLDYFFGLADDTLAILEKRLQNERLSDTQRQQFLLDKDAMVAKMKYAVPYLVVLKYRSTIEKVMGYKFADSDWRENWYMLARWYLYYEPLIRISNRELRNKLPDLLDHGDMLMPGLYQDRKAVEIQSNDRLGDVIAQGKTAYNPQSRPERIAYKIRSFQSRMLSLLGPALLLFSAAAGLAGYAEVSVGSMFTSVLIIALTIYVFWKPHKEALRMDLYDTMKWLIDQREARLRNILDPSGVFNKTGSSSEQKAVDLARQEGSNETAAELDLNNSPRVDAIVIISEDEKNVSGLKNHADELRGRLIRNDIPVEVVSPTYKGSANAYYEALLMVKEKFEARQGQYSNVKPWKDARVAFIFHGREAIADNTLIDWSITNAYRAAASMAQLVPTKEGGRSGSIVIFSRDFYAGPIQQVPGADTTILTSRVSGNELNKLGWVSTSFSENGDSEVDEVLEKVNIKDLLEKDKKHRRGSNTVKFFRLKLYDLYNAVLKQFSAFTGIILMGPDAMAEDVRIAERLRDSGLRELLAAHLTSDVIIPKLIARNPDDAEFNRKINDYVEERGGWSDFTAAENTRGSNLGFNGIKFDVVRLCKAVVSAMNPHTRLEDVLPDLKTLYDLIGRVVNPNSKLKEFYAIIRKEVKPDSKIHAYVPHGEVYMPGNKEASSFKKIQSLLGLDKDAAMSSAAKRPGGIDLNFQPQFIRQPSSASPFGIQQPNALTDMPDGFKGFNFNIVRFTTQLTVNNAFQLMFTQ